MAFNIYNVLKQLFGKKRLFTSEADFQFALAWEIKTMYPNAKVNLEYRYSGNLKNNGRDSYIDIVVEEEGEVTPIELKYKTKGYNGMYNGRAYSLKDQSAQDCARYDFWKDVERLEHFISNNAQGAKRGYVIFLTNDSIYWNPSNKSTIDKLFRIHDGRKNIKGVLDWCGNPSPGTINGRNSKITIKGDYSISWDSYFLNSGLEFMYMVLDVSNITRSASVGNDAE